MSRALAGVALCVAVASRASAAPPPPEAMDVDREDAPPGRGELGFDGGAPLGEWALAASLGVLDDPIALRTSTGLTTHPVSSRETLGLGGGYALGASALVDLHAGFAHQAGDRLQGLGDAGGLEAWVPLDARVGLRLRVLHGEHVSLFLRGELTLPSGNERDFAGDAGVTGTWEVIARAALPGGVIVAANGGVRIRGREVPIADQRLGDETTAALGVVVPVPPLCHLWCKDQVLLTGEVVATFGDEQSGIPGPSPAEARVGIVSRPRPWLEIAARVGFGLDDDVGAPTWRAMLAVTWRAPGKPDVYTPPKPRTDVEDPGEDD